MKRFFPHLITIITLVFLLATSPLQAVEKNFTLGEKTGDFCLSAAETAIKEVMTTPLVRGLRIARTGEWIDPICNQFGTLFTDQKQAVEIAVPFLLQDINVAKKGAIWLLFTSERASFATRFVDGKLPAKIDTAPLLAIGKGIQSEIIYCTENSAIFVDSMGTNLTKIIFNSETDKMSSKTIKIDPWGAAVDPETNHLLALRANGGSVNTVIEYDDQLEFVNTHTFSCGETGELILETIMPGGTLILSLTGPCSEGIQKRFFSLNTLGAFAPIGSVRPHPLLRQLISTDTGLKLLEFKSEKPQWDCMTGILTLKDITINQSPATAKDSTAKILFEVKNFPTEITPALSPDTYSLAWLDKEKILLKGKEITLSKKQKKTLQPILTAQNRQLIFADNGKLVLHQQGNPILYFLEITKGKLQTLSTVSLELPKERKNLTSLTQLQINAKGEIYLTDTLHYSLLHWTEKGKFIGEHKNLAGTVLGEAGEFFQISEGDSLSHKVLLHYDGNGNYLRVLGQVKSDDETEQISGTRVLGRDKLQRVWWTWYQNNQWILEAIEYKTQKSFKKLVLPLPENQRFYPDTFQITAAGGILVATRTKEGTLQLLQFFH